MKVEQPRPTVYALTMTAHELTTLVAAARMCAAILAHDADADPAARQALDVVLADLDAGLARTRGAG